MWCNERARTDVYRSELSVKESQLTRNGVWPSRTLAICYAQEGEIQEIRQIEKQRVGSMVPTRSKNSEIGSLSARFPQRIERKKQSERDVLQPGTHPFLAQKTWEKRWSNVGQTRPNGLIMWWSEAKRSSTNAPYGPQALSMCIIASHCTSSDAAEAGLAIPKFWNHQHCPLARPLLHPRPLFGQPLNIARANEVSQLYNIPKVGKVFHPVPPRA